MPEAQQQTREAPGRQATMRPATVEDGAAMWRVARDTGVLDLNSPYAYLMACAHFGDTCVVAEIDDRVVGFITGYRLPRRPEVVFVWQVGVDESARGRGVAGGMLDALVDLEACSGVTHMETTVTPSNAPSQALFRSFARRRGAEVTVQPFFGEDLFPGAGHEAEELYRIGPLGPAGARRGE